MTNVVDLDLRRDRQLDELTRRAQQLPHYKRLAVIVAICEMLREKRRIKIPIQKVPGT